MHQLQIPGCDRTPQKAALRYFGGKWSLAPWILGHFPPHTQYLEPFGGGFSVGLQKPRSRGLEIYNEANPRVLNFFHQVQANPNEVIAVIHSMPQSTPANLREAWEPSFDDVEDAARIYYLSQLTFSGVGLRWMSGFSSTRAHNAIDCNYLMEVSQRLQRVELWGLDFREAIAAISHDPDTLIYCDPPYVHSERITDKRDPNASMPRAQYAHEMTDQGHRDLARMLNESECMAIVSGYQSALYDEIFGGGKNFPRW